MGFCLLGAHVNTTVGGLPEMIREWKPPLVVVLDHSSVWFEVKRASPHTLFVGRLFQQYEPNFNEPTLYPLQAARDHCAKVLPWAERMGKTYRFWQGVNEPAIASVDAMKRCAEFDAERARIMAQHGFRVVVGSFSVGNPDWIYWPEFLPALEAAQQYGGALALHEYAWPTLQRRWPYYLLRHRKIYGGSPPQNWPGLPEHLKTLPLLITECGLDGLITSGREPRGWRVLYGSDPAKYVEQLAWYDAELSKDPYVMGAALYCCGVSDPTWRSYDIWPQVAQLLAQDATPIYRLPEPEPAEPTAPFGPSQPLATDWQMEVTYRPGPRILAGTFPSGGIELTITDPWGNAERVIAGSKPEHGPGGFEVLAPHIVVYTLSFLDKTFEVQSGDQITFVTFTEVPRRVPSEPLDEDAMLELVLERVDRIIDILRQRL
jgi:hypothetical protein